MRNYLRKKPFSLALQLYKLRKIYPGAISYITKNGILYFKCLIRPTPLSRSYPISLKYKIGKTIEIWLSDISLELLERDSFPHYFTKDKERHRARLCLYRYSEFNSKKWIADTIIPWTVEWLFFYEIWLATGKWQGGGEHPVIR